jgi:hypothetical protein
MKISLSKIEALLQTLVEGSALNLFPSNNPVKDLSDQMVIAFKSGIRTESDGKNYAPDFYTVIAHPNTLKKIAKHKGWRESLLDKLRSEANKHTCIFLSSPAIQCEADPTLSPQKVEIIAQFSIEKITSTIDLDIDIPENENDFPANAFFIVSGNQTFPLTHSVVNIGRRPDNDLVIDDARISRLHAQLRAIKGHFVIFDLDSTGGTSVNGQKIHQWLLSAGDVISLAGIPLVYGQETNPLGETEQVSSNSPASA